MSDKTAQPDDVKVGQIWKDNDLRSKGTGEFRVVALEEDPDGTIYIRAKRRDSRRTSRIRKDRLLGSSERSQGYTYIGMTR